MAGKVDYGMVRAVPVEDEEVEEAREDRGEGAGMEAVEDIEL